MCVTGREVDGLWRCGNEVVWAGTVWGGRAKFALERIVLLCTSCHCVLS